LTDAPKSPAADDVHVTQSRIFVVDELPAFADALAALLATADDFRVVGTCSDLASAAAAARRLQPDLVTVDVGDAGSAGASAVAAIHAACPQAAVVVVTTADSPHRAIEAIGCGATAWASKSSPASELFDVLRTAAAGYSSLPPRLLTGVLRELCSRDRNQQAQRGPLSALTPREYEVLLCLVEGLDRNASARRLQLSVNTIRTHVQSLFAKLGVHNTLQAVAVALESGLRPPVADADPAPAR
jgi:DNA-binding NarL/FixJ family response regulator